MNVVKWKNKATGAKGRIKPKLKIDKYNHEKWENAIDKTNKKHNN